MTITRKSLVHTGLMGSASAPEQARLLQLGKLRGVPTIDGGIAFEIEGNGVTRRAELTPFEVIDIIVKVLKHYGVRIEGLDPKSFRHTNG